jgi:hypothetical protein
MKGRKLMKVKKLDETKTFLAVVPVAVDEKLREEAKREKRSRQAQLARILEERYGFVQSGEAAAA